MQIHRGHRSYHDFWQSSGPHQGDFGKDPWSMKDLPASVKSGNKYWCFRKWWETSPQIIYFNRVFHVNHPFWGTTILGNTHINPEIESVLKNVRHNRREIFHQAARGAIGPGLQWHGRVKCWVFYIKRWIFPGKWNGNTQSHGGVGSFQTPRSEISWVFHWVVLRFQKMFFSDCWWFRNPITSC